MNKSIKTISLFVVLLILGILINSQVVSAQPFGFGKYNENVPYGSATSLTISSDGNVTIPVTPTEAGTLATGNSVVTVTSTDVIGFKLYIRTEQANTNLVNGPDSIPASANVAPGTLAVNTWGYNTDGSSNFVGLTLSDVLIKNVTGPASSGNNTTITYGIKIDNSKPAGVYSKTVSYTAAPQTD